MSLDMRFVDELDPQIAAHPQLGVLTESVARDRGRGAMNRGDYQAALRLYDEALSHGDDWRTRRGRGKALHSLERYDEALADFGFWLANGASGAEALLWRAYALGNLHRTAEAQEALDLARTLDLSNAEIAELATYYDEADLSH